MKKIFALVMVVSILGGVLAGCGDKAAEKPADTKPAAEGEKK